MSGLVPPHVRFLDDVFRIGARAEHTIGKAEEPTSQCFKSCARGSALVHTHILSDTKTDDSRPCDRTPDPAISRESELVHRSSDECPKIA
jgi:hypothetical protein